MSLLHITGGGTSADAPVDSSEVFSTYIYTGNGSTQNIVNGIDLAGKGGMTWFKCRSDAMTNLVFDSVRGSDYRLQTNSTSPSDLQATGRYPTYTSNGFTLGADTGGDINYAPRTYTSWTFRKAPKFFHQELKVHTNGTASTVDLSTLGTVGMVTVKSTVNAGNWFTWHRSLTAGNNLNLNLDTPQYTTNAYLSVSGTTLTIASTAPSDTYIVYSWAHDTSADGIIQCGSFTGNGAGAWLSENLGWEAQWLLVKPFSGTGSIDWWQIYDSMRGMSQTSSLRLVPNLSNAEDSTGSAKATATGFDFDLNPDTTYIYMAIRRPNKVPTSGTEVYNAIARTGTTVTTSVNVGFSPDMMFSTNRDGGSKNIKNRLSGVSKGLMINTTAAENDSANAILSIDMLGVTLGYDSSTTCWNSDSIQASSHFFKRAKGFFDIVCYTGTTYGASITHNLGVSPQLIIQKIRTSASNWIVLEYVSGLFGVDAGEGYLNDTGAFFARASRPVSSTTFAASFTGVSNVAYLFASVPNVSKVGSYAGNGTSQTINCGFSTGARFILIKRTDLAGDWYIWDTVRGIVAGNDPHLSLNTTTAEVTTDDSIDPDSSGFIVNQVAATNVNVTSATYIFLAIS